jgi:hypothetical protein
MTTPGSDAFDYTDDSVIARVSIDVPASSLTDISQLTQAMSTMRVELEAIARAQSDWLDYLQQVPQIAERANQAYRESLTQMERIAYVQNEIGGGTLGVGGGPTDPGGGGAGYGGSPGTASGYSTAAPQGYVNPFKDMVSGTGQPQSASAVNEQINQISQEDPRLAANMMAQRGIGINPNMLGTIGGVAAGMLGKSEASPGGGPGNVAAAAGTLGAGILGTGAGAAAGTLGARVLSETKFGNRISDALGMGGGGGGDGGGTGSGAPGWGGRVASVGRGAARYIGNMSTASKVAGGLGLGAVAFNEVQNIGERVTQYQQLGAEEGGSFATGMEKELSARVRAIDPFVNAGQVREAMQKPMSEGYRGDAQNELRDVLLDNFKEMGISMADSAAVAFSNLKETDGSDAAVKKVVEQQRDTAKMMHDLAGDGGASLSQRVAANLESTLTLNEAGLSQANIDRSSLAAQEAFADTPALRGKRIEQIQSGAVTNANFGAIVAQRTGVTGYLPEVQAKAMEEAGYDADEIFEIGVKEMINYASGQPNRLNRIAVFRRLMNEANNTNMSLDEATKLYEKYSDGKDPKGQTQRGNEAVARNAQKTHNTNWNPISYLKNIITAKPEDILGEIMGNRAPSEAAERTAESFAQAGRGPGAENYAPSGRKAPALPQNASQVPQTVNTQGRVSGNVTITVDQAGRVTAPPTIQLTGTQRAVNAGAGSAQLNNAQPGENYANKSFPGGGN